jgi:hypothetical protein
MILASNQAGIGNIEDLRLSISIEQYEPISDPLKQYERVHEANNVGTIRIHIMALHNLINLSYLYRLVSSDKCRYRMVVWMSLWRITC